MKKRILILIIIIFSLNIYCIEFVKVNIIGYPRLTDFFIKLDENAILSIDGKKHISRILHIYNNERFVIIDNDTRIYFKEILIKQKTGLSIINCEYGDQDYRGDFKIRSDEKGISIINIVKLEDYFASVLGSEMGDAFSFETLKAQAIAIRTYFYNKSRRYTDKDFDINNADGMDMVYRGASFASKNMYRAFEETKEFFLVDKSGSLGLPLFHSTSGGVILKNEVMNSDFYDDIKEPVLVYDIDDEGKFLSIDSPYYEFEAFFDEKALRDIIISKIKINKIKDIKVKYFNNTECVDFIGFIDENSKVHWIKGYSFVSMAYKKGYHKLRSIQFNIKKINNLYVFTGKGFGHLCGMSQYSAEHLARDGGTYIDILNKYYPQYKIKLIKNIDKYLNK